MTALRLLLPALLWLVACSPAASTGETDGERRLTVVSWNLEWFPGGQPNATASAAALQMAGAQKALEQLQPDILLVQEVRNWKGLAALCTAEKGLEPTVISAFPPGAQGVPPQQVGIASRLPVNSSWSEEWPARGPYDPPRGFAFAAIELPERFILVYSVHFKSNRGNPSQNHGTRETSARQLLEHMRQMRRHYAWQKPVAFVVGGDFNTSLDDGRFAEEKTLRMLREAGLHWAYDGVPFARRVSLPAKRMSGYPDACFDHLFTEGLGKPEAHVVTVPNVSDHMPVVMTITLPPVNKDGGS